MIVLRFLAFVLVVLALMLLGADIISTLEAGGEAKVRTVDNMWMLLSGVTQDQIAAWLSSLPAPAPDAVGALLSFPAWAVLFVVGVIMWFLFRQQDEAEY